MREFSDKLLSLYKSDYSSINLTRILESEEFYHKQIIDSLYPFENFNELIEEMNKVNSVLDIGFGGGFPLIPLAKIYPDKSFYGFEARGKKAKVVQEIASKMNLENVKTFHERIEGLYIDLDCLITFKAVGKIADCLNYLNTDRKLNVVFYKGPGLEKELSDHKLPKQWNIKKKFSFELQHEEKRIIVVCENNVPCGTRKNKTNLSSLVC